MNNTRNKHDSYITVVTCPVASNKMISRCVNGLITKTSVSPIYDAHAETRLVATQPDMLAVLAEVSEDPRKLLILSYIPDTSIYRLVTAEYITRLKQGPHPLGRDGVAVFVNGIPHYARLKENYMPSSWFLMDLDEPDGMPDDLKFSGPSDWFNGLGDFHPALKKAGRIIIPSSSSRVLIDGLPYKKGHMHALLQAKNPADLENYGARLSGYVLSSNYAWVSQVKVKGGQVRQALRHSVFDPSTFTTSRPVYEGKPVVSGDGLTVIPSIPLVIPGDVVDTQAFNPFYEMPKGYEFYLTGAGSVEIRNRTLLNGDVEVVLDDGSLVTIEEYRQSSLGRLRCQCPFRPESNSLNGILTCTANGEPVLHDNGMKISYHYVVSADEMFGDVA